LRASEADGIWLDEKIEEEKEETDCEKNGAAIDATARKTAESAKETGRRQLFEAGFFAEATGMAGDRVARDPAANGADLIAHPDRNLQAVVPEENGAGREERIAEESE